MNTRSALNREHTLRKIEKTNFDITIIGGGITGAGIALDAASRGMSVLLIEKADFANGTSSKSTKLIHGGLRYLKNFEIGLVREVGRERAIVHKVAPHLVVPRKMLLPFYTKGTFGPLGTSIGLWVYDRLANVQGNDKRKMLTRQQTIEKEPLLQQKGLKGSGYYAEYRADDARLTIENIKTAIDHGALCINYLKAENFLYDGSGKISGINCSDQVSGKNIIVKTNYVINATGPWADLLRKKDDGSAHAKLFLSKGVHIVFPKERFPLNQAIYFDVSDGRMVFAIPTPQIYLCRNNRHKIYR
jgi:glycerol-3-phosphate dehydrogenase